MQADFIYAQWPAPANVHAFSTTRRCTGGHSRPPYDAFNLALHVDDNAAAVEANRAQLNNLAGLPSSPVWLDQVHSDRVLVIEPSASTAGRQRGVKPEQADASVTAAKHQVCSVLTADCLPVFFCNTEGSEVAVAHAGWRGLHAGVLEQTVAAMKSRANTLLVWLGPAIGAQVFEVGAEVKQAFIEKDNCLQQAFEENRAGHFLCDMYLLAKLILNKAGIANVYGGEYCTFSDAKRFYSFRRDGDTGRMANLIWFS